ncbi:MAG TPA: ATP-binding protein [Candidatus Acidoferrum sp.]|nr:ATP-binding protein [Candidatus Acidoferrum sp.]
MVGFQPEFQEQTGGGNHPLLSAGGARMGYEQIRIVLNNELTEIARLHQDVENFGRKCGLSSKTQFELNLILEEVLANIISYGYEDNRRHEIVVRAELKQSELVIEVEDDGRPFNPLQTPPPDLEQPLEQRKVGGLGVHLVRELTSTVEYTRREEKNRLVMRKKAEKSEPTR